MSQETFKIYGYRWIILLVFMAVIAVNQLMWITFAPITGPAASYYGVSDLSIGLLVDELHNRLYLRVNPCLLDDRYRRVSSRGRNRSRPNGYFWFDPRPAGCELLSGAYFTDWDRYRAAVYSQRGNQVAARWFPLRERATATGLGSLAMYLGIVLGLALTPYLVIHSSIESMLLTYGIVAIISAVIFFIIATRLPSTSGTVLSSRG